MADEKDKGAADEPNLAAGDPSDQGPESVAGESSDGVTADDRVEEPTNEELAAADSEDDASDDDDSDESEKELVAVGAAAQRNNEAGGDAGGSAGRSGGRKKKTEATPKQRKGDKPRRTGPVTFVKESVGELRKVVYPTGQQLLNYFLVVLVFVLFIIGLVSVLDLGFGQLIFLIFGNG
ncbi:MAG TPA: preprotein translocase subunit SecE [Microlunatus sp.]|nr:preprotein translocase subunit SecE [Microlunatus sp.]